MHARPTRSLPPVLILASMLLPGCESQPAEPLVGKLAIEAGDLQIGEAGSTLAIPLAVRLTNLRDEPLSGQRIRWQTEHNVVVRTVSTDETGTATFQPLLGPDAGEQRTIAVREGFPEEKVTFKSIVQVQGATQMEAGTGGHGSYVDTVLAVLPVPYEVRITDQDGAPVAGVGVAWTAKEGGAVSPPSSVTDANGVARATHVLGTRAGPQRVVASVEGLIGSPV